MWALWCCVGPILLVVGLFIIAYSVSFLFVTVLFQPLNLNGGGMVLCLFVVQVSEDQRIALVEFITHLTTEDWPAIVTDMISLGFLPHGLPAGQTVEDLAPLMQKVLGQLIRGGGIGGIDAFAVGCAGILLTCCVLESNCHKGQLIHVLCVICFPHHRGLIPLLLSYLGCDSSYPPQRSLSRNALQVACTCNISGMQSVPPVPAALNFDVQVHVGSQVYLKIC